MPDYRQMTREAARAAGIDPELFVRQINQESGYAEDVIHCRRGSSAGAQGIAQIVRRFHPNVDPCNPEEALAYGANLMAGHLAYWRRQGFSHPSDIGLALASYNAGRQATIDGLAGNKPGWPFNETVRYLSIILEIPTTEAVRIMTGRGPTGGTMVKLSEVLARGRSRAGDPYVWDGEQPGGFDCLVADTVIVTDRGPVPIDSIMPGDAVLTRDGYRPVLGAWLAGEREVWRVPLSNERDIVATGNHLVLTRNGWKPVSTLDKSDILIGCDPRLSSSTASGITVTRTLPGHPFGTISSGRESHCIRPSTRPTTARSLQGTRSTTRITTPSTTTPQTWKPFLSRGIDPSRPMLGLIVNGPVAIVGPSSRRSPALATPATDGIALAAARRPGVERPDWIGGRLSALAVAPDSIPLTGADSATAGISATHEPVRVVGTPTRAGSAPTFDLEVEGRHEFYANGVLVSNCSGFIKWTYNGQLTSFTDAIFDETARVETPAPGDIVLYQYADPSQPGVRFPHVGLFLSDAMTLDARDGYGVGEHPQLSRDRATRYYRRAKNVEVDTAGIVNPPPPPPPPPNGELERLRAENAALRQQLESANTRLGVVTVNYMNDLEGLAQGVQNIVKAARELKPSA